MKAMWIGLAAMVLAGGSAYAGSESNSNGVSNACWISEVAFAYGHTHDDIDVGRIGIRKDFGQWLENRTGWLSMYVEGSLNEWKKGHDKVYAVGLSPVFVYYFGRPDNLIRPYIEGGIGGAFINETEIGGYRQFSTAFQFEDRAGLGVQIKNVDLCCRYMHYSNAGIKQPNDGIDIVMASLGWRL